MAGVPHFLIPEFLFPQNLVCSWWMLGLAIIQMRKCQLTTIFTGILDKPHLEIKIVWKNKNICVHYKVTLRTFVSTLDFAMLIVLRLGSDGQIILKWIIKK